MALLGVLACAATQAQQYPTRPIRWIVPVPAGSTTDIVTRLVAQKMTEAWGQQVVVDNRPGGVFTVGSEIVAKAPSDGYTIGTLLTPHVVNPFVMKNLPYDTERDFTPVSMPTERVGIRESIVRWKDDCSVARLRRSRARACPRMLLSGAATQAWIPDSSAVAVGNDDPGAVSRA
jgi:hypothetical protein